MLTYENRHVLARELFPKGGVGAELGVYEGTFAAALLREAQPAALHLVDLWAETGMKVKAEDAEKATRKRFDKTPQVQIHKADGAAWLRRQPASSLDWTYHDSAHGLDYVYRELCHAFRAVKAGGVIAGHDYGPITPGVIIAVWRFCENHGLELHAVTDEPEYDVEPRQPWMPKRAHYNSYAIKVVK